MSREEAGKKQKGQEWFERTQGGPSAPVSSGGTREMDLMRDDWVDLVRFEEFRPEEADLLGQEGSALDKDLQFETLRQLADKFAPVPPSRFLLRYLCASRGLKIRKEYEKLLYAETESGKIGATVPKDPAAVSEAERIFSAIAQMTADTFSENEMPKEYCRIEYVRGLLLHPSREDFLEVLTPGLALTEKVLDLFLARVYERSGLDYYEPAEFRLALVLRDGTIGPKPYEKLQILREAYDNVFTGKEEPAERLAMKLFSEPAQGTVSLVETGSRNMERWLALRPGRPTLEDRQLLWHTEKGYRLSPFFKAYLKWYRRQERPSSRTVEAVFAKALAGTKPLYAQDVAGFLAVRKSAYVDRSDPDWALDLKPRQLHALAAAYVTIRYRAEEGVLIPRGSVFYREARKSEESADDKVRFETKEEWMLPPAADELTLTGEVLPLSAADPAADGGKVFLRSKKGPLLFRFDQPAQGKIISVAVKEKVRCFAPSAYDGRLDVCAASGTVLEAGTRFTLREGDDAFAFETTERTVFWPRAVLSVRALTSRSQRGSASKKVVQAGEAGTFSLEKKNPGVVRILVRGSLPLYADDLGVLEAVCTPGTKIGQGERFTYLEDEKEYEYETVRAVCAAETGNAGTGARIRIPVRAVSDKRFWPEQENLRIRPGDGGRWLAPKKLEAYISKLQLKEEVRGSRIARFSDRNGEGTLEAVCRPGTRIEAGETVSYTRGGEEFRFLVLSQAQAPDEDGNGTRRHEEVRIRALERREDHPGSHPGLVNVQKPVFMEAPEALQDSIYFASVLDGTNFFAPDAFGTVEVKAVPGTVVPAGTRFWFEEGDREMQYELHADLYACTPVQVPVQALTPVPEGRGASRKAKISVKKPCYMKASGEEASGIYEIRVEKNVPLYSGTGQAGTVLVKGKAGTKLAAGTRFRCGYAGEELEYEVLEDRVIGEYASGRVLVYATDLSAGKKASHGQGYELAATGSINSMEKKPEAVVQIFNEKPLIGRTEETDTRDEVGEREARLMAAMKREVPDDAFFRFLNEDTDLMPEEEPGDAAQLVQRLRDLGFAQTRLDANVVHNFAVKTDAQKRSYLMTLTFLSYVKRLDAAKQESFERGEILNEFESAVDETMKKCRYPLYYRGRFYDCLLSYLLLYAEPVTMLRLLWMYLKEQPGKKQ